MKRDNGRYFRHKLLEFRGSILSSVQDTALCYSISAIRALIRVHCPNINDKLQLIEMTASFNLLFFDALDISPRHFFATICQDAYIHWPGILGRLFFTCCS